MLTSVESFWLQWQAAHGRLESSSAASAWLAAIQAPANGNEHWPPNEAAISRFRQQGLEQLAPPTLQDLLDTVERDNPHISSVAETALRLFDATQDRHQLKPVARRRLASAARLHHLAGPTGDSAAALEAVTLADVSQREQAALVAVLRAADRKPIGQVRSATPPDAELRVLTALLQLADAIDYDQDQATRLVSATLTPAALGLVVRGLGAPTTARRVRLCRRLVRQALATGLRVSVAPPTLDELKPLLNETLTPQTPMARVVQRGVAAALLAWEAALELALTGEVAALTKAERNTADLRQVLGALRPVLKRKATQRLRQRLGQVQKRLRSAQRDRIIRADALAYTATREPEARTQMQPLLEALDRAARKTFGEAETWLRGEQAVELCDDLLALVGAVPLRHGPEVTLRQNAPALLKEAAEAIATRRANYDDSEAEQQRRLCEALVRGQAALDLLGGAALLGPEAQALAGDLANVERCVEGLRETQMVEEAIAKFLDEWAERQAKHKAPQMSGVDAVLAYRHERRAKRQAQRQAFMAESRPLRARPLNAGVKKMLATLKTA